MLRKGIVLAALLMLPALANAQARGPFELTLSGNATNGSRFNGVSAGVNGSIGYFFSDVLEVGLRQGLTYTDIGPKTLNGSTRVALDLHFPLGDQAAIVPFIGANGGFIYGDSVNDTWIVSPEAGLKWFVNNTTFIFAQVEYQIFLDKHHASSVNFSDGVFQYGLGIGFRF